MDSDAPPLVQADAFATQGEQLTSRKAFQQALDAHNSSAKQYQVAAQATSDITAAKALLLQRDRQLKLANDVQRRLNSGSSRAQAGTKLAPIARDSASRRVQPSQHAPNGTPISPASALYRPLSGASAYAPRERIEASSMVDSRYSRHSSSPSASQISTAHPASGESGKASSVEESYYLLRDESDPSDHSQLFQTLVDDFVKDMGNAVAYASLPLHVPTSIIATQNPKPVPAMPSTQTRPPKDGMQDSFYIVPQAASAKDEASQSNGSSKTQEELLAENATLKETLDNMAKQFDLLRKQRQREREDMRGSVNVFARDVKRQVERVMSQSTANLVESQKRIADLQDQLRTVRIECEKQTQQVQHYKGKYEGLRRQIADKRKANKDAAEAAAAARTTGAADPAPS